MKTKDPKEGGNIAQNEVSSSEATSEVSSENHNTESNQVAAEATPETESPAEEI